LPSDQRAGTLEVEGGIERGGDASDADAELLACLRGGVEGDYDEKRQKKHQTRQRVAYDVNRGEAHRHLL
jgi:hypothetical protein